MNNQELDSLFRDKLMPHRVAVSDDAWDRLQAKRKKYHKSPWLAWSLVAMITLLLISSLLLIPQELNKTLIKPLRTAYPQKSIIVADLHGIYLAEASKSKEKDQKYKEVVASKTVPMIKNEVKETSFDELPKMEKIDQMETESINSIAMHSIETLNYVEKVPEFKIVIAYKPSSTRTKASTKEERKSLPGRLNDIAREVKESGISLSELREAKNEFLAFNFLFNPDKVEEYVPE